jgi:hypothetical protein
MTDALDRTRIINVAIAEQPVTPALPTYSKWLIVLIGTLLALTVSVGLAFALEYLNPSFRTPTEVFAELNIPVLAAVPYKLEAFSSNGKGNSNGNGSSNGHGSNGNGAGHSLVVDHEATDATID